MFQIIKFDDTLYGVCHENQLFLGTKFKVGAYAIDNFGADAIAMCEVMAAFNKENKNFASFGINGFWVFITNKDVSHYLPAVPGMERGVA